jgi:cob(I)alamin adenosyltransferase
MPPFYTRTGDDGFTSLLGEGRVPKYSTRTWTIGAVDEATAAIGVARAFSTLPTIQETLLTIQRDLYGLMAEVAATPENAARFRSLDAARVAWLEGEVDRLADQVTMPREFILPGDTQAGAFASVARAVVRRAERQVAEMLHAGEIENVELLRYLNRLSSLLFVVELMEAKQAGHDSPTLARTHP